MVPSWNKMSWDYLNEESFAVADIQHGGVGYNMICHQAWCAEPKVGLQYTRSNKGLAGLESVNTIVACSVLHTSETI